MPKYSILASPFRRGGTAGDGEVAHHTKAASNYQQKSRAPTVSADALGVMRCIIFTIELYHILEFCQLYENQLIPYFAFKALTLARYWVVKTSIWALYRFILV